MEQSTLQAARPAIGLIQGLLLLKLYRAAEFHFWPGTDPQVFAPLLVAALFVPLVGISGLGNIRPRTLIGWLTAATILCVGLAFYDIFRNPTDMSRISDEFLSGAPRNVVSLQFWPLLAGMLFIAHVMVMASDADRRVIARYATYFDISWKHGIQALLAALFVGVFWAILFLGGGLFALIKISALNDLIKEDYFWIPGTALATGYALHLTDVRAALTRGARSLVLFLLSWLLPIMTLLAVGFVAALPFKGLEALWSTRHAGAILLATCAMLVFLINTAYQDGESDQPLVLRLSRLAASLILLPLTALAGYALLLRVQQYGWSPDRVVAAACTSIAAFYALGYLYAAARFGLPLRGLELVNIVTAVAIVLIVVGVLAPIADPARISVNSQVARLLSGKVAPEQFDFAFLKFDAGRYGQAALVGLGAGTGDGPAQTIAERATAMLSQRRRTSSAPGSSPLRNGHIEVIWPQNGTLPDSFSHGEWEGARYAYYSPAPCLSKVGECDAALIDLDGDGQDEVILWARPSGETSVFKLDGDRWKHVGSLEAGLCGGVREAMRQGKFELMAAPFKDILVSGNRLRVNNLAGCGRYAPTP